MQHPGLQVRSAAEEYHAEFAAKEATIAALTVEADTARSLMQAEIDALRAEMEVILAPFVSVSLPYALHASLVVRHLVGSRLATRGVS
jgi:hypothetical protein